ncbi:hypothetical protein [Variovorax rhizosphaerae]|uniref:DUF4760 domain-containing protein n=1 Tax=Variovorax rhizosphaerae TaxID=1836200 RepID=A0ABU8WQE5_9BURK
MSWNELFLALGGVAGVAAGLTLFAKLVAEKSADAALRRFEHTLKLAEENHRVALTLASTVDTELRTQRRAAYILLWSLTGKLPQWPRNDELQYSDLRKLSGDLRDWYFQTGGIYLSESARKVYGTAQERIHAVLAEGRTGPVGKAHYETLRKACSALRTELTEDLLSRRESPALPVSGLATPGR